MLIQNPKGLEYMMPANKRHGREMKKLKKSWVGF